MKHHLITDGHGAPLAVILTGGNRNGITQLVPLIDAIPAVRGRRGRPRSRPDSLFVDRGYDHDIFHDQVRARRIVPAIARRGAQHGTGLSSTASSDFASAGNAEPTSTKPSSNPPDA